DHREAAKVYVDYLMAEPQQVKALQYGFRPGLEKLKPGAPIDKEHGVDPAQPQRQLEVPPAEVLEAALKTWQANKKHTRIVLVFDRSGSMNAGGKLSNAKKGARQVVKLLGDQDSLGLLTFSDNRDLPITFYKLGAKAEGTEKTGRETLDRKIDGLFADGETALYDSIEAAHDFLEKNPEPNTITAIIVLTDGEDNK